MADADLRSLPSLRLSGCRAIGAVERPRGGAILVATWLCLAAAAPACAGGQGGEGEAPVSEGAGRSIEEILQEETEAWMAVPGVVGTGMGLCEGAPCIVVFVTARTPEVRERIPDAVDGHLVRIEVTGEFRPRDTAGG